MNTTDRRRVGVNICVPLGTAAIWAAILKIADANGGVFMAPDVMHASGQSVLAVRDYIAWLKREKFVTRAGRHVRAFQLVKRPANPPSSRPEQEHLWTAMRTLKSFTLDELCFAATTDTQKISKPAALRYIGGLVEAGYLTIQSDSNTVVYRLKVRFNSGPRAPTIIRMVAVFDHNTNRVPHDVIAEECDA